MKKRPMYIINGQALVDKYGASRGLVINVGQACLDEVETIYQEIGRELTQAEFDYFVEETVRRFMEREKEMVRDN